MPSKKKRIILAGGGSGGPTSPLLATAEALREKDPSIEFLFIGTAHGPEAQMVAQESIPFVSVPAGKWRRYWTWKNIATPFLVFAGFISALRIISKYKPDAALGAGSFAQVPVLWACWVLRVPIVIHQQDIQPTLANILCSPIAKAITVTFEASVTDFSSGAGLWNVKKDKVVHTGNPWRQGNHKIDAKKARAHFGLSDKKPVLFVTGGGTGAQAMNDLIWSSLPELTKYVDILHQTGKGKLKEMHLPGYVSHEFIDRMDIAYAASDIVFARAGISTTTELANLGKVAIIMPMPDTHQEVNALFLASQKAAIIASQNHISSEGFISFIRNLLLDGERQKELRANIRQIMPYDAAQRLAKVMQEII